MIAVPKEVCILAPGTYKYVRLNGKGKYRLQMELRLLINWPENRELLDYWNRPKIITR